MVDNCKNQINILFEDLRAQYDAMLVYKLDSATRSILDNTLFEQKLEIDSLIVEKVPLLEAMNYVIIKSFDAQMSDLKRGERKLKESEDFYVRNYENFQATMEILVSQLYDLGESNIETDFNFMLQLLYGVIIFCCICSLTVIPLERLFNSKEHQLLDLCKSFGRPETIHQMHDMYTFLKMYDNDGVVAQIITNEIARIKKNDMMKKRIGRNFVDQGSTWIKAFFWVFGSTLILALLFNVFFYTQAMMLSTSKKNLREIREQIAKVYNFQKEFYSVFAGYEGAIRLQLIEDQTNPYLSIFTRQVDAGARTVFEKKAFTMLYFRENVEHLKTLYSA